VPPAWASTLQPVRLAAFIAALGSRACFFGDTSPVGGKCVTDAACQTGLCVPEALGSSAQTWLGGYCSQTCGPTSACPAGSTCLTFEDASALCVAVCSTPADCRMGYVCASGACLPDCRFGWSCGTALVCDPSSGACVAPAAAPGPIGSACTLNAQCASGLCTPEAGATGSTGWTGGYCTQSCAGGVGCPTGSTCVTFADGAAYCSASCTAVTECRPGYACATGACLPDCRLGWSCGSELACDPGTGACVYPQGPIGSACTLNAQCASGLCTPETGATGSTGWTGGYCTQSCADRASCPAGSTCVTFADGAAYCAASCSESVPCRQGYVCSGTIAACLPDCRQGWGCGTTLSCDQGTGMCG
jgi:hypothetical protein